MRKKKFFAVTMAAVMTLSLVACGEKQTNNDTTPTTAPVTATATPAPPTATPAPATPTPIPAPVGVENASITFEDGKMDFVQVYSQHPTSGEAEVSIADFNGSKALKVANGVLAKGKTPWIGIDVASLLGANVANVAGVEMMVGTSNDDGEFYSISGDIYSWWGENLDEAKWGSLSVYMEKKNPKVATVTVPEGCNFVADANNIMLINFNKDTGLDETGNPGYLYIDDIRFYDAAGNTITADTSVAFAGPEKFSGGGLDLTNLCAVTNAVEWTGAMASAGAWTQAGVAFTDEIKAALVPGSVIEISYKSDTGNMWVVMNEAAVGWTRVGVGDIDGSGTTASFMNNSKTTAQVTYEQIASMCGDDISTWGSGLQFESDGAWEVFSVKVGQAAPVYVVADAVEWTGAMASAGAWTQAGAAFTDEVKAALVPGSVLEVAFTSDTGHLWAVMNEAAVGWTRVGVGNYDGSNSPVLATCYDGKCYITYEQIESLCGDVSTWGSGMQFESDGAWEVYSVKVGKACEMKMASRVKNWEGAMASAGAWTQAGAAFTDDIKAALVPGSVLNIAFASDTGHLWVVMNEAAVGWTRVGVGNYDGSNSPVLATCNNGICQVTYEQIESLCGDVSTWGSGLQFESDGAWEVYSVTVGQMPAGKEGPSAVEDPAVEEPKAEEPKVEEPKEEEPKVEEPKVEEPKTEEPKTEEPKEEEPKTEASVSGTFGGPIANYSECYKIPGEELAQFADGVTVTLDFEIIEDAAEPWYQVTFIKSNVEGWPKYKDDAYYVTKPAFNSSDFLDLSNSPYSFTLTAAAVAEAVNGGFGIQVHNVNVLGYTLTAATDAPKADAPAENTSAAEGTSYTVTTTANEYWGVQTDVIPADAFANCKNGAKVVVEFTQDESSWWNLILINNEDGGWVKMGDYITNYTCNKDGFIDQFSKGDSSMTLELNAAGVEKILSTGKGILFQGYALNVTKATIIPQ